MAQPRLLLEPDYSLEQRTLTRHAQTLPARPDFLVAYALTQTTVKLVNPNCETELPAQEEWLLVSLAPALLIETATRLNLYGEAAHLLFRQPLVNDARLQTLLETLLHEWRTQAAGWREMLDNLIHQLTVHLLRQHINVQRSGELELSRVGLVDRRLRRAIEFMHDHCGRELNLREIADAAYVSEFHFARLFKKITGQTPHAYLAALRLTKARRLLAETDIPIADVAAQVGYTSQSHFTKVFRAAAGLTPKAFRAAAQKLN